MHYLDNAATTRVAPAVTAEIARVMAEHFANPSSLYGPGLDSELLLRRARATVAAALGCGAGEVYFTACGSESNNIAILGQTAARRAWADHIVCTGYEHPSVHNVVEGLEKNGWRVSWVMPDAEGHVSVEALAEAVTAKTALVAAMEVNNETGAVLDTVRLAKLVKAKNSRTALHVDGVQAWLRRPVKLDTSGIDSYSVSGHKIHAPKGIGALYLRKNALIQPPFLGGGQEKGIRPGTENLPYIAGLALAADTLRRTLPARAKKIAALNRQLREGLADLEGIVINSPADALPEVLNLSLPGVRSETMLHFLEQREIYVSSGSACSKGAASHTLAAMGLPAGRVDSALRISFCADNTPEDVDALLEGLRDGLATLARAR